MSNFKLGDIVVYLDPCHSEFGDDKYPQPGDIGRLTDCNNSNFLQVQFFAYPDVTWNEPEGKAIVKVDNLELMRFHQRILK